MDLFELLIFYFPLFGIAIIILFSTIWMIVVAFKESKLQGFLYLMIPFYSIYFIVTRWKLIKKPFFLSIIGLFLLVIFYYNSNITDNIQNYQQEQITFRIKILEQFLYSTDDANFTIVFDESLLNINYPIIYTDATGEPTYWKNVNVPKMPDKQLNPEAKNKLMELIKKFDQINNPISLLYYETTIGHYHYGKSYLIKILQVSQFIEILIIFILSLLFWKSWIKRIHNI